MRRICLLGQLPPPVHGLSKALETIIKSKSFNEKFALSYIDIKDNRKFLSHMQEVDRQEADIYYFTISQTKMGNLRDMFILWKLLRKKKRVVIHYHGGYYRELYKQFGGFQRMLNRKLLSRIDIMIVLSEGLRNLFDHLLSDEQIKVCENCIEDDMLLAEPEFEAKLRLLAEGKDRLDVLYLSNFIKSKGYPELLEAARKLRGRPIRFHFAGKFFDDQDEVEFQDFIRRNGLESSVRYHGVVGGEVKKQLLADCDVFALPTYYPNEGQPISIIEAMGNGLTIVSTRHAGIPDIVGEDNGLLVPPQSPDQLAAVIGGLQGDAQRLAGFARANRKRTLENFKESDYVGRLEIIMNEV